jgi:hypothetical protein
MINHTWVANALSCSAQRIKDLRPFDHYSWADYRIKQERITLGYLYDAAVEHNARTYLEATD